MKRLLALILALCLLLSACQFQAEPTDAPTDTTPVTEAPTDPTEPSEPPTEEPTEPEDTIPAEPPHPLLVFEMTQADVDEFYRLLQECEPLAIAGEDMELIDQKTDELDDHFEYMADQLQIAYVLYCIDQENTAISDRYLTTTDTLTTAQNDYLESVRRIYLSDTPAKDMLFEDWTEKDIEMLLAHSEEATELEKRNAEILVEYRALPESTMNQDMIPLYSEMVRNNNRIAQIYGYANYYEYAYDLVYQRDYDAEAVASMRQYLATYLAPLCDDLVNRFNKNYSILQYQDQSTISRLLFSDYTILGEDYLNNYLDTLDKEAREQMNEIFTEERSYFTGAVESYTGAFTTSFNDAAFCYFGPGYANLNTVVHELGHYYAAQYSDLSDIPMDLAEVHSQGNEWLLMSYLRQELDSTTYVPLEAYKLYETLATILVSTMVDEFEEKVYTHPNAGNLTAEEYEQLMVDVAEKYGGLDYIGSYLTDMQSYWRIVCMESPVYYISYAVSAVAALNIHTMACDDVEDAKDTYKMLCEEADNEKGFLWNLEQAGLTSPFDEQAYKDLADLMGGK